MGSAAYFELQKKLETVQRMKLRVKDETKTTYKDDPEMQAILQFAFSRLKTEELKISKEIGFHQKGGRL